MSERKSSSGIYKPHKRVRPEDEDEDGEEMDDGNVNPSDEEEELLSTQMLNAGGVSDAGILESITLKNFMCHSNLGPFAFGSNVNFIVGNNGSGKSAILTAIIVTLGGNAQATNRGLSLKSFIKQGESSADVSITLRNRGKDAYKPEVYGFAIIVDMKISRDGLRTYKLRAKTGQIISNKKDELISILDNFNIQVNNPVSILTQEMSKYFLHSKGEGDKYKFFIKATQLEQMREDLGYAKTTKKITEEKYLQHKDCLKDLQRNFLEKEERYKSLATLDEMQTKLGGLMKQMAWAVVADLEEESKSLKEALQSARRDTEKYDRKVDEWEKKVTEAEERHRQIQEQLEGNTRQVQVLHSRSAELKAEVHRRNNDLKSSEVTVHRCRANLRNLEKDKSQLSSRLNDLKLSISQTTGAESQARTARMEEIKAELENLNHHISTLSQQIEQYQNACSRTKEEQVRVRRDHQGLQRSLDANKRNLQALQSSRSNRLRRFGENMPALLSAIDDAYKRGKFKQKPRGPLGHLISLKNPDLALSVEVCLKGQLQAFTCDNHEDERVLQGLMAKVFSHGRRPTIITSNFLPQVHDTRRRAVNHPRYPTVLQALEIEDPVVANCLIDQRGIECILLIEDRTEARRVMQGGNPPQNCTQAFSKDGDQIFNNRSYTTDQTRANFLSGDVEEEIRHLQREIENQNGLANRFQQETSKLDDSVRQNDALLRRTQMDQKTARDKALKLQLELTDLKNVEEPQSEDLRPLEEELQEIISEISSKRVGLDKIQAQMAELKASYEEAEQEYERHKEQINTVAEEADSIKDELNKTDQELMRSKHHKKHYDEKRSAHLCNIETLEGNLQSKEQELQTSIASATKISPERPKEQTRNSLTLDREISRLRAKIRAQEDQHGDKEEIIRQYKEASESYNDMAQQIKYLVSFMKSLDRIMTQRLQVYQDLRRFLSARCKYYFDSTLAQRGYTGNMTFDHKNETLSISVWPGEGKEADLSEICTLSGGERSFATVCFVLALWGITEAPFRCLDEFDVFMDMVNRRISMDMLLKVAAGQPHRQFIFLTPQSMCSLNVSRDIHILRLKDPDRGNNDAQRGDEEQE